MALAAECDRSLGLRKARNGVSDLAFRRSILPEWFFRSAEVASVCTLFKAAMLYLVRPSNMLISLSLERPSCSAVSMQSTELASAWICWATLAHVAPYLFGSLPALTGQLANKWGDKWAEAAELPSSRRVMTVVLPLLPTTLFCVPYRSHPWQPGTLHGATFRLALSRGALSPQLTSQELYRAGAVRRRAYFLRPPNGERLTHPLPRPLTRRVRPEWGFSEFATSMEPQLLPPGSTRSVDSPSLLHKQGDASERMTCMRV